MPEEDHIWIGAYSAAMGMLALGASVRGNPPDTASHVDSLDFAARGLADRVLKTIQERDEAHGRDKAARGERR